LELYAVCLLGQVNAIYGPCEEIQKPIVHVLPQF